MNDPTRQKALWGGRRWHLGFVLTAALWLVVGGVGHEEAVRAALPAAAAPAAAPTPVAPGTPGGSAAAGAGSAIPVVPANGTPGSASPVPPTAQTTTLGPAAAGEGATTATPVGVVELQPAPRVIVTADGIAAESDHDAIVGGWGIDVRPVATTVPVFSRRASMGCPLAAATVNGGAAAPGGTALDCPPIAMSMLGVRHWVNRNLAWTVGAALALGGGTQNGRLLDTYLGFGPGAGVSLLLGNWKHLAVAASPSLALVWFRAAKSVPTTYVADLRADLEGELHFGFIGVPALSLGIRSGVLLRLERAADLTLWSAGVSGATTLRGLVSDLSLRYYF